VQYQALNKLNNNEEIASFKANSNLRREFPHPLPALNWPQIATPDGQSFIECIQGSQSTCTDQKGAGETVWALLGEFGVKKPKNFSDSPDSQIGHLPTLTWEEIDALIEGKVKWHRWSKSHPNMDAAVAPRLAKYESFCSELWKGDFLAIFDTHGPDAGASISSEFSNSLDRYLFCRALTVPIVESNLTLESMDALHALTRLSLDLLSHAASHQDFWTGRFIMVASQLFCANGSTDEDPQVPNSGWDWPKTKEDAVKMSKHVEKSLDKSTSWSLHRGVYQHPLWNRVTFWDAALVITLSEDKQRNMLQKIWGVSGHDSPNNKHFEESDLVFRQKNPCCKILHSFSRCMVAFGIVETNAVSLIERVYQRYRLCCPE